MKNKTITSLEINNYLNGKISYPFPDKKERIMIIDSTDDGLKGVLSEIFVTSYIIDYKNCTIIFYVDDYEDLTSILESVSFDLGLPFKIHNGIYISRIVDGSKVKKYLDEVLSFISSTNENNTDLVSPLLNNNESYKLLFDEMVLSNILSEPILKDIILTYFKCDLNVLKTSKALYMNRNSLINKLDNVYKQTGINLQKFSHAAVLYTLIVK